MRRKSERNKAKGSPEKKVEKATRRTTRRRGKPSPSTSPERENAEDNVSSTPYSDDDKEARVQTNDQVNDDQETDKGVSSSEIIKSVLGEDDENRSVWKVARADASPGEIQKLKLCRQRNISEASDSPLSKKISNKWPDSGEGGTEEAESADEQVASSQKTAICEEADDTSSVHPGQDSNEEVSDYKENLSETTSANLSDDKTNIDQQADSKENLPESSNLYEQPICEDNQSSSLSTDAPADGLQHQSPNSADNVADLNAEILPSEQQHEDIQEKTNDQTYVNSITESCNQSNDLVDNSVVNDECVDKCTNEAPPVDENVQTIKQKIVDESVTSFENQIKAESAPIEASMENVVSEQENNQQQEHESNQQQKHESTQQQEHESSQQEEDKSNQQQEQNEEGKVVNETAELESVKDNESSQKEEDQREEGELVEEENEKEASPETDSNVREESDDRDSTKRQSRVSESHSSSRNRGKYRESSTSDTPESDEEITKAKKTQKIEADSSNIEENNKSSRKSRRDSSKKKRNSEENSISVSIDTEIELSESNIEKDDILEITEKSDDLNVSLSTSKPAKVSLKRSFSSRLSTDTEINKEETHKKPVVNESNQNKENHADNDQPDQKSCTKKRRWGMTTTSDNAPEFSISTDSLKVLVPGAKPLSANEVRLTRDKDEDDEKEHRKTKNDTAVDYKSKADTVSKNEVSKKSEPKMDNHSASRRKITVVKDTPRPASPSLPEAQATNILLIRNLVRPFTLNQIKELLSRTGTILENGFWMDRIKSKCFVEYANEDQAFETRQALHGVSWPPSNPKKLIVDYATKEDMELAREISKEQPIVRKTEPMLASDLWQQDQWARDERPNLERTKITIIREWDLGKEDGQLHLKEKERERKEYEKKKRQRSRSPIIEAHLPAPARKFKKKEEEPPTAKLLDDLFRKTKSTPCIYWLPLTNEQILIKEEMRRQHMAEHARRLDEIRRVERSRDSRRRRSPRK